MSNVWKLLCYDVKHLFGNVITVVIVLGLVFLPSIFTWYNVIACWNVFDNTGNLKVAVANSDEGYQSDLLPTKINVGDSVESALRANDQIDWTFTTEEDAVDGARSGRYYAAVVIGQDFSYNMYHMLTEWTGKPTITYYENAKKNAPCIIFIDEIDAVGRQRGAGLGGGNDEREQTLNQMLVEMDGFETGTNIIVIAATNRPDVLDPALLRPGRFDRQVVVPLPDIRGREQILNVHMKKIPVAQDVRADILARGTPGFSGADLANLVNEAALFAARRNGRVVDMNDFELAKDKIMMGAERKSMVMTEDEKRNTAYHESGHALVAKLMPKSDPVHKVTIIPRGRALGVTMQLPEEDHYAYDKQYLLTRIAILFGGRIAEEVFMHQMTTGASNDFERATQMARDMVTRYGMSDSMGVMVYAENEGDPFLGRSLTRTSHISEETMRAVDNEIRRILEEQYTTARKLIEDNADKVEAMAQALLKWETIDADQIDDIMAGKPPREPKVSQPAGAAQPAAPAAVAAAASAQDNGSQPPAA